MKKLTFCALFAITAAACSSNKPANSTTSTDTTAVINSPAPVATHGSSYAHAGIYGKWNLKTATIKMTGPDGKPMMNDVMNGAPGDYYLISEDGTCVSHIGKMVDTSHFKFTGANQMEGTGQTSNDHASLKILSLTASACTISVQQKKPAGNVDVTMELVK